MRSASIGPVVFVLGFLLVGAGCSGPVEVVHGLTEREANEVMVLLEEQDIMGTIMPVAGEDLLTYAIAVPPGDASSARRLLVANGIPRPSDPGYAEATATTGMIPSASDEKMKLLNAKQGEINNSLMTIDGVLTARTLINVPESESLADGPPPVPSASVVIRLRRLRMHGEAEPRSAVIDEEKVRRIVANAVQGLDAQMVEVMTVPVTIVIPEPSDRPAASSGGGDAGLFKIISMIALAVVAVMALMLVLAAKQKKDLRQRVFALQRQIGEGGERAPAKKPAAARS